MTITEKLIAGLDAISSDWWIMLADHTDLQDCVRMCTDRHSGTVKAKDHLRWKTAQRNMTMLRGALEARLIDWRDDQASL